MIILQRLIVNAVLFVTGSIRVGPVRTWKRLRFTDLLLRSFLQVRNRVPTPQEQTQFISHIMWLEQEFHRLPTRQELMLMIEHLSTP